MQIYRLQKVKHYYEMRVKETGYHDMTSDINLEVRGLITKKS